MRRSMLRAIGHVFMRLYTLTCTVYTLSFIYRERERESEWANPGLTIGREPYGGPPIQPCNMRRHYVLNPLHIPGSNIKWFHVSSYEFTWKQMRWSECRWVQVSSSEIKWIQVVGVTCSELECARMSPSTFTWVPMGSNAFRWIQMSSSQPQRTIFFAGV